MAVHAIVAAPASKTRHPGFACKLVEFDQMCAWADACGFQDELFHVVVSKWTEVKTLH